MDADISPRLAKLIIESARDYAIFTLNSSRIVTSWNDGAERLTGWATEEVVGKSADVLFVEEDQEAAKPQEEIDEAERHGRAEDIRWHRRKDGSRFWANGLMMPLSGHDGEYVKIVRDHTGEKLVEDERNALIDQLAHANALQNELFGLISHELRSPLSTITGLAQALRTQEAIDPHERRAALEEIQDSGLRMQRIIASMLDLARSSTEDPELEPVLLQRELPRLVDEHLRRFPERDVQLRVDNELPPVAANTVYLAQIMRNLFDNIEKYADRAAAAEVEVELQQAQVLVRVLDRGPQLSEDIAEQIFAAYYRSDTSNSRSPGLGLGTTVCQRLVEAQGGEIRAGARPGGGLMVWFTLSLAEQDGVAAHA